MVSLLHSSSVIGLSVSMVRGSSKTNFGYAADPTDRLYKLVRAHGNAAEYAPMLAVLIWFLGSRNPGTWLVWFFDMFASFPFDDPSPAVYGKIRQSWKDGVHRSDPMI